MLVLLKSGQSVSREKTVKEMYGTSIDGAPMVSTKGDSRKRAECIWRPNQKQFQITKMPLDDSKPYLCVF